MNPVRLLSLCFLGLGLVSAQAADRSPNALYREYVEAGRQASALRREAITVPAGYRATAVTLPIVSLAGGVTADPADPNAFYVTGASTATTFRNTDIWRVTLTPPGEPLAASA